MVRISESGKPLPPPTPEERERALAALDRIEERHRRWLAARGGRYFPSAVEVLREIRGEEDEETSRQNLLSTPASRSRSSGDRAR